MALLGIMIIVMMAATVFYMVTLEARIRMLAKIGSINAESVEIAGRTAKTATEAAAIVQDTNVKVSERLDALMGKIDARVTTLEKKVDV